MELVDKHGAPKGATAELSSQELHHPEPSKFPPVVADNNSFNKDSSLLVQDFTLNCTEPMTVP
jgi:hypothetical protein